MRQVGYAIPALTPGVIALNSLPDELLAMPLDSRFPSPIQSPVKFPGLSV